MVDIKNILAIAISIVIVAFAVDNIPTIKTSVDDVLGSVSLPPSGVRSSSGFPVKLDVASLTSSFSIKVENAESVTAGSKNVSIIFDDRRISINPSLMENISFESYSGKLTHEYAETKFDGSAKGVVTNSVTVKSERSVKVLANLTSANAKLSDVVGGAITISKATGSVVYNTTNSLSLLGEDVKVTGFKGEIFIGSFGIVLQGNADYIEVKGGAKTISYG